MARALDADLAETAESAGIAESGRTWLGGAGLLVVATSFVVFGGLLGLLAAAVVAVGWYLLPSTYAFALGQIALVSTFSTAGLVPLAAAQAGLLGVLFAPVTAGVGLASASDRRSPSSRSDCSPVAVRRGPASSRRSVSRSPASC